MNFGTILDSLTKNCIAMMMESKDLESKSLARSFVRYINMKDPLEKQFFIYNKLKNSHIANEHNARLFVNEVLRSLRNISFNDIKAYNALLETKFNVPKMKSTKINSCIADLIKHTTSDIVPDEMRYIDSLSEVVDHISKLKEEVDELNVNETISHSTLRFLKPKHVTRLALKKFNSKYGKQFNEDDRRVFSILRSGNIEEANELHQNILNSLLDITSSNDSSLGQDLSDKIFSAIDEIGKEYSKDNVLKAHELLSELKSLHKEGEDNGY